MKTTEQIRGIDPYFRMGHKEIPIWVEELYLYILKDNGVTNQTRFYFDRGVPFLSSVFPTDFNWGHEYTVQELIDMVHERLQHEV